MKRTDLVAGGDYMASRSGNYWSTGICKQVRVLSTEPMAALNKAYYGYRHADVAARSIVEVSAPDGTSIAVTGARRADRHNHPANAVAVVDLDEQGEPKGTPYALRLTNLRMGWAEYLARSRQRREREAEVRSKTMQFRLAEAKRVADLTARMKALGLEGTTVWAGNEHATTTKVQFEHESLLRLLDLAEQAVEQEPLLGLLDLAERTGEP